MTTQTLTLTDFLLARMTEDEVEFGGDDFEVLDIRRSSPDLWDASQEREFRMRARMLAECEAKRRIVELIDELTGELDAEYGGTQARPRIDYEMLQAMVQPYIQHEDYNPEWFSSWKAELDHVWFPE